MGNSSAVTHSNLEVDASTKLTKDNNTDSKLKDLHFYLTFDEANKLQIDEQFDYYDTRFGQFYVVTILQKKNTKLKIHYNGYKSANDKWIDCLTEIHCFAKYNSITKDFLRNHDYSKYFALEEWDGDIESMAHKMQSAMTYIQTNIMSMLIESKRSDNINVVSKWVRFMYYYLFECFISTKLKNAINTDESYDKIVKIFNKTYGKITDTIRMEIDAKHLQISRERLCDNYMESNEKNKTFSCVDSDEMSKLKMMWDTMHREDVVCCGEIAECIAMKRINLLLDIFEQHFIDYYPTKECLIFMDIFNELHSDKRRNRLVLLMNDFEHIREHHMDDAYAFKACDHIDTCICNKRCDIDFEYENNYFGFSDLNEVNVCKYMMKIHTFLCHHEGGVQTEITLIEEIRDLITERKDTSHSKFVTEIEEECTDTFEFGEHFYYWRYFKDGMQSKGDYYIDCADFCNLKEEMLSNRVYCIALSVWKLELNNATTLRSSKRGKRLRANNRSAENEIYEIPVDTPISIAHLMVILFYTNHTELQYTFKKHATRRIHKDESLNDVKKRNKQIGNWYRLLYEVIEIFSNLIKKSCNYYHGISIPLMFNSFNPTFNAPISTSLSITVAAGFAGSGIILCLNASFESFGCMDVSWISNYSQEEERLFAYEKTLFINDIRFDDCNHIRFNHSNIWYIRGIRLFDSIFCNNKYYAPNQKHQISQKLLTSFICQYYHVSFTVMDQVVHFVEDLDIDDDVIKQYLEREQYDSDAVNDDIEIAVDDVVSSNIFHQFDAYDTRHFELFRFFVHKQEIPQYLQNLFAFKLNDIKKKKEKIFIVKSEYTKLNTRLKQELMTIYDDDMNTFCLSPFLSSLVDKEQIYFMDEFAWNIADDEYTKFVELETGEMLIGPHFQFKYKNDNDTDTIAMVGFRTELIRSDISWPDCASIGIRIMQLPLNMNSITIGWNYAVSKPKYLSSDYVSTVKTGERCAYQSFSNTSLSPISSGFIIKLCVRIC